MLIVWSRPTVAKIPLAADGVLRVRCVVTRPGTARMVVDRKEVVGQTFTFFMLLHAARHIQAFNGERDTLLQLFRWLVAGSGEALEMDYENIRCLPDVDLFRGMTMLLASGTIPRIAPRELFFLFKQVQTFFEGQSVTALPLPHLAATFDALIHHERSIVPSW